MVCVVDRSLENGIVQMVAYRMDGRGVRVFTKGRGLQPHRS